MIKNDIIKKFIVLEGLDGSGTTTQINLLSEKFIKSGINLLATAEPTGSRIGLTIREALKHNIILRPETLALLFAADRNEHLSGNEGIINYIDKGYYVITDRYFFSSIAYQSLSCDMDWIISINNFPLPEYLFFIDVPPEVCRKRMKKRSSIELFEDIKLQKTILENYKTGIAKTAEGKVNYHVIDGMENPESVSEKIWKILNPSADK